MSINGLALRCGMADALGRTEQQIEMLHSGSSRSNPSAPQTRMDVAVASGDDRCLDTAKQKDVT